MGLKEELGSVQSERSRLQQEADSRVLTKSASKPHQLPAPASLQQQSSTSSEGVGPGWAHGTTTEGGARPPKEVRSSGEVSCS